MDKSPRIVITGAGSIGCYVGGCLALAGKDVTFLARAHVVAALRTDGLRVTDLDHRDRTVAPERIAATEDPATAFGGANIVLVTVKSGATEEMAALVGQFAPPDAVVVSLQNGVGNAARIRAALPAGRTVLAGMVPFNVVLTDGRPLRAHRATAGAILIEDEAPYLPEALSADGLTFGTNSDMPGVLWGKLLLNLNNALNALSDLPLATQLSDRRWRKLLASQMDEALAAMAAGGIKPAKLAGAAPRLLPTILRLPDWLFGIVARRMLAIDPEARSSMWEDLMRRRPTEIGEFQGAILRLAVTRSTSTPLTSRIVELIRQAEVRKAGPPGLTPEQIKA